MDVRRTPRIWRWEAQGHCELFDHPKVVQEMLGHASITLTMDTYSHVLPGMQEESAVRLDALLAGSCPERGPAQGTTDGCRSGHLSLRRPSRVRIVAPAPESQVH